MEMGKEVFFVSVGQMLKVGKIQTRKGGLSLWVWLFLLSASPFLYAAPSVSLIDSTLVRDAIQRTGVFSLGDFRNLTEGDSRSEPEGDSEPAHPLNPETAPLWKEDHVPRTGLGQAIEIENNIEHLKKYAAALRAQGKDPKQICLYIIQNGLTWSAFAKGMVNAALEAGFTVVPLRYADDTPQRSLEKALAVISHTDSATLLARYLHIRINDHGEREGAPKAFAEWFKKGLIEEIRKEIWKRRKQEIVDVMLTYLSKEDGLFRPVSRRQVVKAVFLGTLLSTIYFATNYLKYHGVPADKFLWTAAAFRLITESLYQYVGRAHNRVITKKEWRPNLKDHDTEPVRYYIRTYFRSAPTSVLTQLIFHGTTGTLTGVVFDPLWNSLVGLPTKFWRQIIAKKQKGIAKTPGAKVEDDDSIDTKLVATESIQGVLKDGALLGLDNWIDIHQLFNWIAALGVGYELRKHFIPRFASRTKSLVQRFVRRTEKDLRLLGSALRVAPPAHQCTLLLMGDLPADRSRALTLGSLPAPESTDRN